MSQYVQNCATTGTPEAVFIERSDEPKFHRIFTMSMRPLDVIMIKQLSTYKLKDEKNDFGKQCE